MEALDTAELQPARSRAYYAVFAIVAIALALFVLRWEMKAMSAGPEAKPKLSHNEAGFLSDAEMKQAEEMLKGRRFKGLAPDQEPMVHRWLSSTGKARLSGLAVVARLDNNEQRKRFLPDFRALYATDTPRSSLNNVIKGWCKGEGADLVKGLRADENKEIAAASREAYDQFINPRMNVSGR